jgi:hypothetical protein
MVIAAMAVSAFFALFFLRALMMIFKPKFIFGENHGARLGGIAVDSGSGS